MIASPCNNCIFIDKAAMACGAGEYCVKDGARIVAPGLCKVCRSESWKKDQLAKGATADDLLRIARTDASVEYDIVVVYDRARHTLAQLAETVQRVRRDHKVIVSDVSEDLSDSNWWFGAIKDKLGTTRVVYQALIAPLATRANLLSFATEHVHAPYFMLIEAGQIVTGLRDFAQWMWRTSTRAVFYRFAHKHGNTLVFPKSSDYGMYVTHGYNTIREPFFDRIKQLENLMDLGLIWETSEVVIE